MFIDIHYAALLSLSQFSRQMVWTVKLKTAALLINCQRRDALRNLDSSHGRVERRHNVS